MMRKKIRIIIELAILFFLVVILLNHGIQSKVIRYFAVEKKRDALQAEKKKHIDIKKEFRNIIEKTKTTTNEKGMDKVDLEVQKELDKYLNQLMDIMYISQKMQEKFDRIPDYHTSKEYEKFINSKFAKDNAKKYFEAISGFRKIGEPAVPYLLEMAKNDIFDPMTRDMMAELVGNIRSEKGVEGLINIINDKNNPLQVRSKAIDSLGMIGNKEATETLFDIIQNEENDRLRADAVANTPGIRDREMRKKAVEVLVGILGEEDIDSKTKRSAVQALGFLCDPKLAEYKIKEIEKLTNISEVEKQEMKLAWEEPAVLGKEIAVDVVIEMLKDKDESVRFVAASTLGFLRDKRATEPLIEYMRNNKNDAGHAVFSLAVLGDIRAIPQLRKNIKYGYDYVDSAKALCELGDYKTVREIVDWAKKDPHHYYIIKKLGDIYKRKTGKEIEELMKEDDNEI